MYMICVDTDRNQNPTLSVEILNAHSLYASCWKQSDRFRLHELIRQYRISSQIPIWLEDLLDQKHCVTLTMRKTTWKAGWHTRTAHGLTPVTRGGKYELPEAS
jgi:hypothetical protein